MNLRATFSILLIFLLTACGGSDNSGPVIPVGAPAAPTLMMQTPLISKGNAPPVFLFTASTPHGFKKASAGPRHAATA